MNKIVNLDEQKKQQVVYTKENNLFDNQTGEVITQENTFIKKELKRDQFIKLFLENVIFWVNLDNKEKNLLFLCINFMNWVNVIKIDSTFKKNAMLTCEVSRSSVTRAIDGLIEKNVLKKLTKDEYQSLGESIKGALFSNIFTGEDYLINPQIVGKGSFRDIRKIRQTIVQDFDFDTMEMTKQVTQEAKYDGFDDIKDNTDKHEIKEITQNISENGKIITNEIVIGKKDEFTDDNDDEIINVEPTKKKSTINKQKQLELNFEQGNNDIKRQMDYTGDHITEKGLKELDLAILEAENEKLKLELELLKIKSKLRIEK